MWIVLVGLLSWQVLAEDVKGVLVDQAVLTDRLVSTLKETQVDAQLAESPVFKTCLEQNKLTKEDLADPVASADKIKAKQRTVNQCLKDQLQSQDPKEIQKVSDSLELDKYGLVKNKDTATLINYLAGRIELALYGENECTDPTKFCAPKKIKLVDHKAFYELYDAQLGKNLLLELSKYCYQDLRPISITASDGSTRFKDWQTYLSLGIITPKEIEKSLTDTGYQLPTTNTDAKDAKAVYTDFAKQLQDAGLSNGANGKKFMENLFGVCQQAISVLCQSRMKQSPGTSDPANNIDITATANAKNSDSARNDNKSIGQKSCVLMTKLKDFRTNKQAIDDITAQINNDKNIGGFRVDKTEMYDKGASDPNKSIDSIVSISAKDLIDGGVKAEDIKKSVKDLDQADCAVNGKPEDPKCASFFYGQKEELAVDMEGQRVQTAIAAENLLIDKIKSKDEDLKKYLEKKGYFDLLEDLKAHPENGNKIVEDAKEKFKTEKEAVYAELQQQFKDRTLSQTGDNKDTVARTKAQISRQKQDLGEVILFNNVITSYLGVKKGKIISSNTKPLQREIEAAKSLNPGLEYFTLAEKDLPPTSSNNQDPDLPSATLVDVEFINQMLGKPVAKKDGDNIAPAAAAPK